jgi:hypothetical protein
MSALIGIYTARPNAHYYAIFEDDLLACSHLRDYLEQCEYPSPGYWNLLTHDMNMKLTQNKPGWHPSNQKGKGAVGLVFNKATVIQLLQTREFATYISARNRNAADGMVIDALHRLGYIEYVHYPSLLQHVGLESVMGHGYGVVQAFHGTAYNPLEVLPPVNWKEAI